MFKYLIKTLSNIIEVLLYSAENIIYQENTIIPREYNHTKQQVTNNIFKIINYKL